MSHKMDYVAVYKKSPFSVSFNIDNMRNGAYYIEGAVTTDEWLKACKQIDVPPKGQCSVTCTIEKKGNVLKILGEIHTTMCRTCVRTLEKFKEDEILKFHEQVFIDDRGESDMTVVLHGSILEMKEYFIQQIILHMNAYPIHPKTISTKQGEFGVNDGQEKAIKEEKAKKNPFSVLKGLKSDP